MQIKRFSVGLIAVLAIFLVSLATAQTETVLYSFTNTPDGSVPQGGVIFDKAGNMYGTTTEGGNDATDCAGGCGTVFELTHGANDTWTETVLHSFDFNGTDGVVPRGGLIFDATGNLYGTTANGGTSGVGIVFELSPNPDATWTEKILLNFNYSNGTWPWETLIFDAGNLYGTARGGGTYNRGTVFELSPGPNGTWTEKTLHNFGKNFGTFGDGADARGMILGADGNFYGVTAYGGYYGMGCAGQGCGIIFELVQGAKGKWTEKVLHRFNRKNGAYPNFANPVFDAVGNLYGTTYEGGPYDQGVVFQLVRGINGTWTEKMLFEQDGGGNLIFDNAGNIYGTIPSWGLGWGSVFRLTQGAKGKWTETGLYSFKGWPDGANPIGTLTIDADDNLYGTTACGGSDGSGTGSGCGGLGYGTVYKLTP